MEIGFINRATPKSIWVEFITFFAELTNKISIRLKQFTLDEKQNRNDSKTKHGFCLNVNLLLKKNYLVEAYLGCGFGVEGVIHLNQGAETKNHKCLISFHSNFEI